MSWKSNIVWTIINGMSSVFVLLCVRQPNGSSLDVSDIVRSSLNPSQGMALSANFMPFLSFCSIMKDLGFY